MFRTLLIILMIYFAIRLISPWIKRWLLGAAAERIKKQYEQQNPHARTDGSGQDSRKEGDVKVVKPKSKPRENSSKVDGEYIDFEEIE